MDLSINLKVITKIKINTQIHTQKLNNFFCTLNNLIRNLQKICEIPKPKTLILKKLKTQTQTKTFGFFIGCICLDQGSNSD